MSNDVHDEVLIFVHTPRVYVSSMYVGSAASEHAVEEDVPNIWTRTSLPLLGVKTTRAASLIRVGSVLQSEAVPHSGRGPSLLTLQSASSKNPIEASPSAHGTAS